MCLFNLVSYRTPQCDCCTFFLLFTMNCEVVPLLSKSFEKFEKKNKNRYRLWPTYTTLTSTLCIFQYLPYVLSLSGCPLAALPSSFTFIWFCMCLLQWTHRAWRLSLLGLALCLWGITNGHSCWSCPSWHSCFINK